MTENTEEYQPADNELFTDLDKLLAEHVPFTAEETHEIDEMESQFREMEFSIRDFLIVLQNYYLQTKNPEHLEFRRKILKKASANSREYNEGKPDLNFQNRKKLLTKSIDKLEEITAEINEWRKINWPMDS